MKRTRAHDFDVAGGDKLDTRYAATLSLRSLLSASTQALTGSREETYMNAYLISNVRILDGTGREPFPGVVRVEAERIVAVTEGTVAPPGDGATVLEGRGATLMPGLIESHAHIGLPGKKGSHRPQAVRKP